MKAERWQQIEQLCQAALDRDASERAAFLDEACAGDEALRRKVESLLAYQTSAERFIKAPALEMAAKAGAAEQARSLVGRQLGHYRILSLLGAGAMGEVYLAEDTRLGRKVALKLLPAQFTADPDRVRRFEQEARAASALNHPNIITIHEIGQAANTYFLVTEFIDGQTLRQRTKSAQMKLREVLEVAVQAAGALAAAHAAGIVHRDVKPENIMLRTDGYVKVLDFGLAKLIEPLATGPITIAETEASTEKRIDTAPGVVMGTVKYMSPEQVRGEAVDGRTDIFSLGVVLYEVAAGRAPFEGNTSGEVMAAILEREPLPLARYTREASAELERIVRKALAKDREERYQVVKDLLVDLRDLKQELELESKLARARQSDPRDKAIAARDIERVGAEAALLREGATRVISGDESWARKIRRHWRSVGLFLSTIVIVATAAFFYINRAPAFTEKDTVLLADFINTTGDQVFDGMLKQGLAVQLEQSPFLNLFPDERVRETLRYMGLSPDERVTSAIASEICQRQGLKAMLTGSIGSLGHNYVITLAAINGQTGGAIAHQQVEAEGKEQVLRTLGRAASQLREKLGESLHSIQRFDTPIEQATTSSLDALKALSLGVEQQNKGNDLESIPFLKRALELDHNFALAYIWLTSAYANSGQPELAAESAEKAFALRGRVTEREKLAISEAYYTYATAELDKSIEVLKVWKRIYPRDWIPPSILANDCLAIGQYEKAIEASREAIRLNPNASYAYGNLVSALISLGHFDEAQEIAERALAQELDDATIHYGLYSIAFIRSDTAEMKRHLDRVTEKQGEYWVPYWKARTAAFSGQLRQAQAFTRQAVELAGRRHVEGVAASFAVEVTLSKVIFGLCRQTERDIKKAFAISRSSFFQNFGVPILPGGALALALCGEVGQAQSLADEAARRNPKATLTNAVYLPVVRATIELRQGHSEKAIQLLQVPGLYEGAAHFWPTYLRGQAFLHQKAGTEAEAEFRKMLDHRGWDPLSAFYPLAHLGLARAAALTGDVTKSRKAYQDFLGLWKNADPDLPILTAAKQEYASLK